MDRADERLEIVAAGGVVIDARSAGTPLVLLVHRPKYDDWSLPKGKADPGETIEETALREVQEETGLVCRIIRELPSVRYDYQNRKGETTPKIVHYFLMEPVGGSICVNLHEIDRAEWFEPSEAIRVLDYEHDKALLDSLIASRFT